MKGEHLLMARSVLSPTRNGLPLTEVKRTFDATSSDVSN